MPVSRIIAFLLIVGAVLALGAGATWAKHRDAVEAERTTGLANATLLVIRHAEKPNDGRGLSSAGEARARAYVDYFRHFMLDGRPLRIDTLVASTDSDASERPRLTLEPLAAATGLPIQTAFANKQVKDVARWLAAGGARGNTLIAWHHGRLAKLIEKLGADPSTVLPGGEWPADVYDWVIVLRYDGAGRLVDSRRIVEPADLAARR